MILSQPVQQKTVQHRPHPKDCSICLNLVAGNVVQLECLHVFHFECIDRLFAPKQNAQSNEHHVIEKEKDILVNGIDLNEVKCPLCQTPKYKSRMKHWVDYVNPRDRAFRPKGRTIAEQERRRKINKKPIERKLWKEARERLGF